METERTEVRRAFVHVGTHKTGTTSIQSLLARNAPVLASHDVYVPATGRPLPGLAGHHNIAWELAGDPQFDRSAGTFDELLDELRTVSPRSVTLSSEEFEFLHAHPAALVRLRDGLRAVGYDPHIILYLRPQADYLESLYAEIVKVWDVDFVHFFETILTTGAYDKSLFDYDELAEPFAETFGTDRMIVRAYRSGEKSTTLLREFLTTVAPGPVPFKKLRMPHHLTKSMPFGQVLAARSAAAGLTESRRFDDRHRFDPLTLLDLVRVSARFARSNERVHQAYGAHVGCAVWKTLFREIVGAVRGDPAGRQRKGLIRTTQSENDGEAA